MALFVGSVEAKNPTAFVTQINALLGPLLSHTIRRVEFYPGQSLAKFGDDLKFDVTYDNAGTAITTPFLVNTFSGNTLATAVASAQAFISANPTYFLSPIQCLVSSPGTSRTASNVVCVIYNTNLANGTANWAGGGTSGGSSKSTVDWLNVKNFGALGDGASHPITGAQAAGYNALYGAVGLNVSAGDQNDYAAIQATMYTAANSGFPVYIPTGTYYVNKSLQLVWTPTPISGQPTVPSVSQIFGDGSSTVLYGVGIAPGRGIVELLGTSNIYAVNCELAEMDIIAAPSSSVLSYCLRMGDAKQSFSGRKLRLFGANCLSLRTDNITSWANICTHFQDCTFVSNYSLGWGPETGASVYAINCETTGSAGTQTWVDQAQFEDCLIGGLCRLNGLAFHLNNCLHYCPATRPSPFNRCVDFVHGGLVISAGYFEDYAEAVHIEPDDTTRWVNNVAITGTVFNGSPIYGSLCKYAIKATGNATMAGNGIGSIVVTACGFDANHTTSCIGLDRADATVVEPNDDSFFSGAVTIEQLNGARLISINRGQVKLNGSNGDKSCFESLGNFAGTLFSNFGNQNAGTLSTYTFNFINDASSVANITQYSSVFVAADFQNALYLGAGANGKTIIGQAGTPLLYVYNGHLTVGTTGDDGTGLIQVNGPITLRATSPGGFPDGLIWNDATQTSIAAHVDGFTQFLSAVPSGQVNIADVTVANTLSELSISGAKVFAAAFWKAGKSININVRGYLSSTANPTLNIKCKWGAVLLCQTGAVAQVGTPTNTGFEIDVTITCRSVGATGTLYAQGWFKYAGQQLPMVSTAVATVDTTVFANLDVTTTWGALNLGNTMTSTNCIPEVLQ